MSRHYTICCCVCGLTQEQAGEALGIEQQVVGEHFQKHLDAMANVSKMLS